ncbi:hypothetical protein SAMN04489864_103203 [Pedobacter insulae]|uniref:Uncharacterized protein n=1 Tax=Pedobacter insulae TaxID=414048 RepID=A0A1I2VR56_9SPHI|nr:hypothetical protein SAMN04489864_103203 [Pedobacter insulae]
MWVFSNKKLIFSFLLLNIQFISDNKINVEKHKFLESVFYTPRGKK